VLGHTLLVQRYPEINQFCPNIPIILLGTKSDLRSNEKEIEKLKTTNLTPITTAMGEALAVKIKAHKYMECSALNYENIEEVFEEAARAVIAPVSKKGFGLAGLFKKKPKSPSVKKK